MRLKKLFEKYCECESCGCLVNKQKTKKVTIMFSLFESTDEILKYCLKCSPEYNIIKKFGMKTRYYKNENKEVDKKGKLIN